MAFHLAISTTTIPDCRAVVHLHCTPPDRPLPAWRAGSWANVIRPFTPYYVMWVGQLPLIPTTNRGCLHAEELGRRAPEGNALPACQPRPRGDGGKDLVDAVNNMEELEETARLALMLHGHPSAT